MNIKTNHSPKMLDQLVQQLNQANTSESPAAIIQANLKLNRYWLSLNKFEKAKTYALTALDIAKNQSAEESTLAAIYAQLAQTFVKSFDFPSTLKYSQLLLPLSQKLGDAEKEVIAIKNLGIVAASRADYQQAIEHFIDGLNKGKAIDADSDESLTSSVRQMTAQMQINIATIYANLYNFEEALQRYNAVLSDYADVISPNTHSIILNNVGNLYISNGEIQKAYEHFDKSYHLAKAQKNKNTQAHTLAQISRALIAQDKLELALEKAEEAEQLIAELKDTTAKPINWINLGKINFKKGNFIEANKLASRAAAMAKSLEDNTNEIRAYKLLVHLFEAQGDFQQALKYQKIYSEVQERFSEVQRNRQALDIEIKYSLKEKQRAIETLKKENELQALLLENKEEIARQNEQLTEVNEDLKQFAYVASHDLKEPLRMIGSYTQLIGKIYQKDADEETLSYFSYVSGGVKRMNNLLDALLQYATIGRSEEELTDVNLSDIVDICNLHLRVKIQENEAIVEHIQLPIVKANRMRMMQLFQNMISNAIKFKKPDTTPVVTIKSEEREEDYLISIQDNGIGIPEEFKERIFVIFQRLHTKQSYEGTGIGLAICHKIIKRLGGSIWVESTQGEGTCFYFTIPK